MLSYRDVGIMPLNMVQKPPFTVEDPNAKPVEGETIPRRHPKAKNGLLTRPADDVSTVFELLKRSAENHPDEPAVGSRKLIKIHKEMKKVPKMVDGEVQEVEKEWQYFELSGYSFITHGEYETLTRQLGSGMRKLGLQPHDKLHLFASTSAQWLSMSHACSVQSMAIVTAYDTLGASGFEHTLIQSKPKALFIDPHLFKTVVGPLKNAPSVKHIIYNDSTHQPIPDKQIDEFKAAHPELTVLSIEELRALGEDHPVDPVPPKPQDLYCIMYTSGSTGLPKGVPITHAGFVAAVAGLYAIVEECVSPREVLLAYLPLAHIFEMVVENLVIFVGATLGYGSARTLVDSSMRNCAGDMRELKPTILVGVPQVWETVKKGVMSRVSSSGPLIKNLFWGVFNLKSMLVKYGLPGATLFDNAVFGQVRKMTGGRLRFIVNGASGISDSTRHFMSMVVAPMINGYGLTETSGNGAVGSPLQWTESAIGPISAAIEVKLVSLPELNYSADSNPPQGEILMRGAPVLSEYFDNPEETEKAITPDGWFHTGDVGEWDSNGHLRVIDRVKNLVKLQGGEYIALEKLEAVYRGSHVVHNVMIYGSGSHPRPIAVISPNEAKLKEIAESLGVNEHDMHRSAKVKDAALKDLVSVGRKAGLTGLELVSGVVLVEDEWTPVNGLVTATQKVNRRALKEKYKKDIEDAFGRD